MAKRKRRKSVILRLLLLAFCAYMIVTLTGLYTELTSKRKELYSLEQQRGQKQVEIASLTETLKDDTKIVEKAARERLGWAYPGEIEFRENAGS